LPLFSVSLQKTLRGSKTKSLKNIKPLYSINKYTLNN